MSTTNTFAICLVSNDELNLEISVPLDHFLEIISSNCGALIWFGRQVAMSAIVSTTPSRKRKDPAAEQDYFDTTPKRIRWQLSKESPKNTVSEPLAVTQGLGDLLGGLEKDQLVTIITRLVADSPDLHSRVAAMLPRPTLTNITQILLGLEKKVYASFPYTKFGPDRSEYSYGRVRPFLDELKQSIVQYLDFFTLYSSYPSSLQHEFSAQAFGYLHTVTLIAHRLPKWDSEARNLEQRSFLYGKLAKHWRIVISDIAKSVTEQGKVYGAVAVGEWAHHLMLHCNEVEGKYGFKECMDDFKRNLGWILGWDGQNVSHSQFQPFGMQSGHAPGQVY